VVQFWPRGHRLPSVYLAFAIAIVATIVICLHNMFFFNRSRQVNLFARRYISSSLLSAFAITFSSCSRQKLILAVLFLVFADEPVTEAYSVLGFPLWWSTRVFFFFLQWMPFARHAIVAMNLHILAYRRNLHVGMTT
jgi:hypothetical protein